LNNSKTSHTNFDSDSQIFRKNYPLNNLHLKSLVQEFILMIFEYNI